MTEAQRFTVWVEFEALDDALALARRLDAEGLSPTVDLGLGEDGDEAGEVEESTPFDRKPQPCADCGVRLGSWASSRASASSTPREPLRNIRSSKCSMPLARPPTLPSSAS